METRAPTCDRWRPGLLSVSLGRHDLEAGVFQAPNDDPGRRRYCSRCSSYRRVLKMKDRQLFRKLLLHFAIGATLGGIFSGVLLILNIQHVLDVVQSSVAPKTTMIILIGGCCTYFAFGATITGFHFILMDNDPRWTVSPLLTSNFFNCSHFRIREISGPSSSCLGHNARQHGYAFLSLRRQALHQPLAAPKVIGPVPAAVLPIQ
jgi:hypothetical protein